MSLNIPSVIRSLLAILALVSIHASALTHMDDTLAYQDINSSPIAIVGGPKTTLDQDFNYPAGQPLINAFLIEIPVGKQTSLHKHVIPFYAYIVAGELEVDYGSKGKKVYVAGTSYVEAIEWCHIGKAVGNVPVKIIGIYLGEQNPDQIKPDVCAKPN